MTVPLFPCFWLTQKRSLVLFDVKQGGGKVPLAAVRQKDDDLFVFHFRTFGNPDGCRQRRTGGDTDQKPFGGGGFSCFCEGVLRGNRNHFIQNVPIQKLRHKICADALYAAQRYAEAGSAYSFLNDETGPAKSNYCFGMDAFTRGDYEAALSFFQNAGETGDAPEKVLQCNYIMGKNRLNRQDVDKARTYLSAAHGYEDAADLLAACDLVEVEVLLADGKLNEAKAAYEKLPPELSYNGISVASRLELLNAHPELLNVCGHWEATSDQIEVSDVPYSSYMSGFTWSAETLSPGQSVAVYCSVNDDGTFCLFGEVSYWQFNNYSSLSSQLDRSVITKDFVVDHISSVPSSIWIDDYTELTYDGSAFRLEYQRDEARTSLFYTQYTSIVNYTDRTGTY